MKNTLETSGEDVKTTLETSVEDYASNIILVLYGMICRLKFPKFTAKNGVAGKRHYKTTLETSEEDVNLHSK
jgi:hypothetical protein